MGGICKYAGEKNRYIEELKKEKKGEKWKEKVIDPLCSNNSGKIFQFSSPISESQSSAGLALFCSRRRRLKKQTSLAQSSGDTKKSIFDG